MIAHRPPLGRSFNPWHFTWIAAVVSEVFTVIITSIQYYFDPTMNLHNLLRVGAIDALFVPLIVVPIVIYFSRNELALRQINVQLEKEIAERNRAETALGSAEEKYRNLIETTDTGFVIIDGHGRVEDANGKYAELCGRKEPADVIGRSVLDWTAPYDQARNTVEVKKCVERGFVRDFEVDYIAPNGKITPVEINATVLRSGDSVTILNLCRDITERKRAEEALREHQEQLDMALQSAHMGVWRHEIKEERHYFDKVTCQILGIDASIFSGKSEDFFKVIHPEDREKVKATIGQTIAQNVPLKIIFRVVWPEGSLHYISSRGRLVCDDAGQPQRLNGILWDVTERLTSEIELQEKETKYRLLFESAKDGIFIVSENGFVDCNQRGAEMYGLTREDVLRRSHLDLAPGRQPDGRLSGDVSAEKMRLVMSGIPQVFEWQSLHSSGQPFDVEITLNKLELGGRMYVQAIVRDISERKRLEHERIRTQKLESIGTLAGGIAHDFNNMLQ
ncbi:MAG TPA: PAS domain S-box protein, partial [Nitrospirota bacterium]|nr:PAS domain S-box protein [Nitrospirota bacterium]